MNYKLDKEYIIKIFAEKRLRKPSQVASFLLE